MPSLAPQRRARYAFDGENRLLIREQSSAALRSVQIVDGTIEVDGRNRLVYHADETSRLQDAPASHAFVFEGTWKLTPAHQLALTLRESEVSTRQTLYLSGRVLETNAHALVFTLQRNGEPDTAAQRLTLTGRWQADANNRLAFLIDKGQGEEDRLTLQGAWEIGEHHQLLYRTRARATAKHRVVERTLAFEGAWDITAKDRLAYRLSGATDSGFEFRASLQSRSLSAREGRVAYQVGIRVSRSARIQRRITLFGTWKLHRDLSVSFDVPYGDGRVHTLRFEGAIAVTARDRVAVALLRSQRQSLGITVTFTREATPDLGFFLRLRKEADETSVMGGVRGRF
ncbi:MAG: hypothetical protein HY737_00195 [Candidatus Omnitrophica bacterium]|nr:hypothetical protein [Candidatus Omnitrophota bacterium]